MNRNYLPLTGALLGSALLVLSSCSSDPDDATETSSAHTTTTSTPAATDVDPASFEMDGRYVFDVPMGDGTTKFCVMGDGSVTCSGTAPEDVPDITVSPFPPQRPGAIILDDDGLMWYMLEGVPPAPGTLEPSQRISVDGVTCETDAQGSLACDLGDNGFTIAYEDATISVRGTVRTMADGSAETTAAGGVDGDDGSTDEPVAAGTWCGVAEPSETAVYVDGGSVGCLTAQQVIEDYRDRRMSEGGGNTLAMTVGEWSCASPTFVSSQELGAEMFGGTTSVATVCENPDGTRIATTE